MNSVTCLYAFIDDTLINNDICKQEGGEKVLNKMNSVILIK